MANASRNSDASVAERGAREIGKETQENNIHHLLEFRTNYVPSISLSTLLTLYL